MVTVFLFVPLLVMLGLLWHFLRRSRGKREDGLLLPPRAGPGILETLAKLTAISDLSSLIFLHEISLGLTNSPKKGPCSGKTSNGAVFRISMPQTSPFIVCTDYELVRMVFEGNSKESISEAEKSSLTRAFDYASTPSILSHQTASQERHRIRKHLASSFSVKNLNYTHDVMKRNLNKFGRILSKHTDDCSDLTLDEAMVNLTLDIITEAAFGVNFGTMDGRVDNLGFQYMRDNELFLKESGRSMLNPFRKYMFWSGERNQASAAKHSLMSLSRNLIKKYRDEMSGISELNDMSIMGRLMSCDYFDDDSRAQDILILLLGGHETSSHSISYLILGLIRNPRAKSRLQCELDSCIPEDGLWNPSILNIADIMSLPYLSQCIKESMRLWSVVGGGPKRVLTSDLKYEGYILPKGSVFHAAYYSMFRQPWINNPDDFIPERWSSDNPQFEQLKRLSMPFGAGQRQCIGQNLAKVEVAVITAYVLRFFDFAIISEPSEQIFLTAKPVDLKVRVMKR